jgi:hypothetical protein
MSAVDAGEMSAVELTQEVTKLLQHAYYHTAEPMKAYECGTQALLAPFSVAVTPETVLKRLRLAPWPRLQDAAHHFASPYLRAGTLR